MSVGEGIGKVEETAVVGGGRRGEYCFMTGIYLIEKQRICLELFGVLTCLSWCQIL